MTNPTATLSDSVMKRLAVDMGWAMSDVACRVGRYGPAMAMREERWTLTPAGCWLVMNAQLIRKDYHDNGRVVMWSGLSTSAPTFTADTPEAALCAAITDMYGEGDE